MPKALRNVSLIGMPGAGKSTLGAQLAKRTGRSWLDVDLFIHETEDTPLSEILAQGGVEEFRRVEERCVALLDCSNTVIATGGSVVYSAPAMEHLGAISVRLYLNVPVDVIADRLGDLDARGVVRAPQQTLEGLYEERRPLYERWADLTVDCGSLGPDEVVDAMLAALGESSQPTQSDPKAE
jgi:shikimate kinase